MSNISNKLLNLFPNICSYTKLSNVKNYFSLLIFNKMLVNCNNRPNTKFFRLKKHLKSRWPILLMWSVPFFSSSSEEDASKEFGGKFLGEQRDLKRVIQEADELFERNKYQEASAVLLAYKECKEVEVMWRLSRALYNQAQSSEVSEADKKQLINDAFNIISDALNQDNTHWAVHKWMSVLLDARSAYDGIKARIMQLERVKRHMLRAVELNPNDATTFYMLGSWCYQIADMPWYQRKIAATIFAAPPTSSFEEALQFFSRAEEVDPRFYSQNLLMLGKTLLKLQRPVEAAYYLSLAKDYPRSVEEDDLVRKEASEILKNLKPAEN